MLDRQVLNFQEEGFQLPASLQCREMIWDASGLHENFYQFVRIEILVTFLYIAYVYHEILTRLNGIFTHLGWVDVDFSTSECKYILMFPKKNQHINANYALQHFLHRKE